MGRWVAKEDNTRVKTIFWTNFVVNMLLSYIGIISSCNTKYSPIYRNRAKWFGCLLGNITFLLAGFIVFIILNHPILGAAIVLSCFFVILWVFLFILIYKCTILEWHKMEEEIIDKQSKAILKVFLDSLVQSILQEDYEVVPDKTKPEIYEVEENSENIIESDNCQSKTL